MDKCVDAAFVGTAEVEAEKDPAPGIDGIFGLEDEAKEDPAGWKRFHFRETPGVNRYAKSYGWPYLVARE